MSFMCLNTIRGWCMARRWVFSPVGIRIRDSSWTFQESVLDWASGWDYLVGSAGVGTIGDTIGTTTGESNSTTTRTFRITGRSSIAMIFVRAERTSTMQPTSIAGVLPGMRAFTAATHRTCREKCIPAPSAGSIMEVLRELIPPEDSPASAASTAAASAAEVSTEGAAASTEEAGTVGEGTEMLHGV